MTRSSIEKPAAADGVSPVEIPSSDAIAGITESGSVNGANSTNVTEQVSARRASSVAIVVLPAPPGPSNVTNRARRELVSEVGEQFVTADDRRETVRDAPDPARLVLARRFHRQRRWCQRGVLGEDQLLQLSELRPRLETELVTQHTAGGLKRAQRFTLATLAVLGPHQQRPPALVHRFGDDECFELGCMPHRGAHRTASRSRDDALSPTVRRVRAARSRRGRGRCRRCRRMGGPAPVTRRRAGGNAPRPGRRRRWTALRASSSSNCLTSIASSGTASVYPRPSDLIFAGEMSLRSLDIWAWIAFGEGGRPGHRTSASRSAATGPGAVATSAASSRRFCTPRGVTSIPSPSRTTSGPRTSNRTAR